MSAQPAAETVRQPDVICSVLMPAPAEATSWDGASLWSPGEWLACAYVRNNPTRTEQDVHQMPDDLDLVVDPDPARLLDVAGDKTRTDVASCFMATVARVELAFREGNDVATQVVTAGRDGISVYFAPSITEEGIDLVHLWTDVVPGTIRNERAETVVIVSIGSYETTMVAADEGRDRVSVTVDALDVTGTHLRGEARVELPDPWTGRSADWTFTDVTCETLVGFEDDPADALEALFAVDDGVVS